MEEALASLTRSFASNADAAKPDDEQATQTGASAHGGQSFSFKQDMVTPRERGRERGSSAASAGWTVHSGDFFARAVNTGQGRAPQERSYLNSHDPVPKAASMGVKFPPVSPLERQQMRELNFSRERLALIAGENALRLRELSLLRKAEIATPPHLHVHGATIVDISEFHFDPSRVEFVLGIGSFSCVHIATREDDGRKVAIKVFHHPVSRGLKSPSNSKHSGKAWLQDANKRTHTPIDARRRHFDPRRMKDEESDDYLRRDAESFKCEVSLLADTSLRHPHILAYLGHGFAPTESGGLAGFIVTEYIVGIDLYAYVRRAALSGGQDVVTGGDDRGISDPVTDLERPGPLTLPLIIKIGRQLATAIAHLHKHGVVHRDIKETNVMMTQASRDAILLDLGLAFRMAPASSNKAAGGTLERSSSTAAMQPTALTTTHELEEGGFGIRGYRAPEVLRHLPYTLAVDVFGFGRILINMLSSYHAPPKRYSLTALRARVIETFAVEGCCPRSLECWAYENIFCKVTCSQRWPRELQDLVRRCLSVTPASRPTMKDIASQLAQMSGGNGSTTRAATRPSKEAPDDAHVAQKIFPRIAE